MQQDVTKKTHLALFGNMFVNKTVGLIMYFIGFQETYYHADTT